MRFLNLSAQRGCAITMHAIAYIIAVLKTCGSFQCLPTVCLVLQAAYGGPIIAIQIENEYAAISEQFTRKDIAEKRKHLFFLQQVSSMHTEKCQGLFVWISSYVYTYVRARDGHATIAGHIVYTGQAAHNGLGGHRSPMLAFKAGSHA